MNESRKINIGEGRNIGILEVGDPSGVVVFVLGGAPGTCRITAQTIKPVAGIRLIGVDRPGIGLSDPHPNRKITDIASDLVKLADILSINRFGVFGHSAGTPHALAVASELSSDRLFGCVVAAVLALEAPSATVGMPMVNRFLWWSSRSLAFMMRFLVRSMATPMAKEDFYPSENMCLPDQEYGKSHPEVDENLKKEFGVASEPGFEGLYQDMELVAQEKFPFDLASISVPVSLWHGESDINTPIAMGKYVSSVISNCDVHILPNEGHMTVLYEHSSEMLSWLLEQSKK